MATATARLSAAYKCCSECVRLGQTDSSGLDSSSSCKFLALVLELPIDLLVLGFGVSWNMATAAAPSCEGVVDGSNIRALVDDDGAFKKFVDEKFRALDNDRTGDLSSQELSPAVLGIGGALGLPPKGSSPETDPIYDQVMKSFLDRKGDKVTKHKFSEVLRDILLGLADGLEREPIKVIKLDGANLREYAHHSDAEITAVTTFVETDKASTGKVKACVLREAMKQLSVDHGAPPPGEASKPLLDAALRKAGVDEDALVDQEQFVDLFRKVLIELGTILSEKPLTVAHVEKKFDGESVKAFLSDKMAFKKAIEEVWKTLPKAKHGCMAKDNLVYGLDAAAPRAGLPPLGAIEEMDAVIREALKMLDNGGVSHNKDEFLVDKVAFEQYMRQILGSITLQLEGKPIVIASSAIVNEAQAGNPNAIF